MKLVLLALLFLIPLTSAIQFSPTSLEFNLEKDEGACKKINFNIETPTTIKDAWAQSPSTSWSILDFQTSAQEHEISINYQPRVNPDEKETEICLSGSKPGNYNGAIIFRQRETGNSVIQFAVWLKVNIKEETKKPIKNTTTKKSSGSSGKIWTSQEEIEKPVTERLKQLSYQTPKEEIKLNSPSNKMSQEENVIPLWILSPIIFTIILFLIIIAIRP